MRRDSASTLMELIMVIVIVGIIAGVTAPLVLAIGSSWQVAQARNELSASAAVAMDRMVREIRQVKDNTSVAIANSSTFKFKHVNNNMITYDLSGGNLRRKVGGTIRNLAANVSALAFTYYDSGGLVIATPLVSPTTNIKRVVIELTFGTSLSFESQASLRNLP